MSLDNDYEIFDHTADIGIKISGNSINEILEKAILATADLLSGGIEIKPRIKKILTIEEEDINTVLVCALEEIIYFFESQLFLPSECSIKIENDHYEIVLKGSVTSAEEIKNGTEIKAVTYHKLGIKKAAGEYHATVIFDV
jgi:SHS2 domain-containing protein